MVGQIDPARPNGRRNPSHPAFWGNSVEPNSRSQRGGREDLHQLVQIGGSEIRIQRQIKLQGNEFTATGGPTSLYWNARNTFYSIATDILGKLILENRTMPTRGTVGADGLARYDARTFRRVTASAVAYRTHHRPSRKDQAG